ncbi:glycosyl hydrolase 53 family protein [Ramlibacter sp.]|uniref:glycosyl hydrolase 53 family protein n=1 Tax=Ramlibacter sp. TaxID=1917967 RepID=UPI002D158284|nr:glycosyl hydrolase 53 family protein [Ramlibacter sp.]HWI80805.1 glycosyl hydrolase 53 family protein [Ramlibacter sp.]
MPIVERDAGCWREPVAAPGEAGVRRRGLLAAAAGGVGALAAGCGGGAASPQGAGPSAARAAPPLRAGAGSRLPSLGGMFLQAAIYEGWHAGTPFDPWEELAGNGMQWARTVVTTRSCPELDAVPVAQWRTLGWKNEYWSCREMGAAVLRRAAAAGMKLQLGLYLSDEAANAGVQKRPAAWAGVAEAELPAVVEAHARELAGYYRAAGLDIEVFEIGNETDFGFFGYQLGETVPVPPGVDPVNTPSWMEENLWLKFVPIFNAAIRGLRSVYPGASIALHVAGFGYSRGNVAPKGFFDAMARAGVPYDIAGFSYPYMTSGSPRLPQPYFAQAEFLDAIDAARALGKRVRIIEFSYPAATPGVDPSLGGYPCTEAGQAAFVHDFVQALAGRVENINYWAADIFPGINGAGFPPDIESFGLFASAAAPREVIGALRRAAADRLFDWAQQQYPALFPFAASAGTFEQYYYRHYPTSQTYLALDERSNAVVVDNGRDWNRTPLGLLRQYARLAA